MKKMSAPRKSTPNTLQQNIGRNQTRVLKRWITTFDPITPTLLPLPPRPPVFSIFWGEGGGVPPRTARQFDDVPLNVVFGDPVSQNRGPRLDSPCRLFCWLGLPASFCRKSGKTQCFLTSSLRKRWKNRVFLREILGSKGEVQGYIHTYIHYSTLHCITLHVIT